ncbi:MAG: hypothetical protein JRI33_02925 [Deltaproteobacteria bacterium]|nr:hypothetical protein [Deltaproteobacteria bacterium]
MILAKFHNPSILNPDFLVKNNIVPRDWKAIEVLTSPPFSTIKYDKKVIFLLDQERFEIRKECEGFLTNYDIHRFASKYVRTLPHVNYTSVGLNWHISVENDNPDKFLIERFINPTSLKDTESELIHAFIKLSFKLNGIVCNVDLAPGKARTTSRDFYNAIIINVNFHYQGPFSSKQIVDIVRDWKDRENYTKQIIPKLIG